MLGHSCWVALPFLEGSLEVLFHASGVELAALGGSGLFFALRGDFLVLPWGDVGGIFYLLWEALTSPAKFGRMNFYFYNNSK